MHQTLFDRYSSISVLLSLALMGSIACAASRDAHPLPVVEAIPADIQASGSSTAQAATSSTPQTLAPTPTSPQITGKTASSTSSGARTDSTSNEPPITVPSVKGRTKKDSLALVKAIRAGMENSNWPVKTPPPLTGSILPAHRIVAFYGNPLLKKMGVIAALPPARRWAGFDSVTATLQRADP